MRKKGITSGEVKEVTKREWFEKLMERKKKKKKKKKLKR